MSVGTMLSSARLWELGIDAARLSDEQRSVLDALSDEEINAVASMKRRLDTADGPLLCGSGDEDPWPMPPGPLIF